MQTKIRWRALYIALPFVCVWLFFLCRAWLSDIISGLWPCPFYRFLKIYCPGCGMSRSALRLLELDILGSLRYNICLPLLLLFGVLAYAEGGTALFGTHRRLIPRSRWFWIGLGGIMAVYFVLRNIVEFMPV